MDQGCDRILLVPLYPQSCAATSATAGDKAFEALMAMRWQPAVRVAPPWHDDPVYIDALAKTVRAKLAQLDFEPDMLVARFHGIPLEYLLKGDPYHCQCLKTGRLLREAPGAGQGQVHGLLPVSIRACGMAEALSHRHDGRSCRAVA